MRLAMSKGKMRSSVTLGKVNTNIFISLITTFSAVQYETNNFDIEAAFR